jgi:glycosyltransferase involved in cell wall biosynthesis
VRALYFGTYERDYPRNAEVIACLRSAGVGVAEWHAPVWESQRHKYAAGAGAALRLARAELRLLRKPKVDFDVMIVGYPGHFDMPLARRAAGKRPLVFNPAVSLYDALVLDRRRWKETSLRARLLRKADLRAFRTADLVVADTEGNADFLVEFAALERERVAVCFLGADESVFRPGWHRTEPFRCFFHGKLIPNHGLETILEAARLAPEVGFRIAGTGQLEHLLETGLPANVEWVRWVERSLLPQELWSAGCALGIFGRSEKVGRVIATKTVEALACGTPVITADTPGARELLTDGVDALLVPPGDAHALAEAVRRLAADGELAERLGAAGAQVYRERVSQAVLGARWRTLLEKLVERGQTRGV